MITASSILAGTITTEQVHPLIRVGAELEPMTLVANTTADPRSGRGYTLPPIKGRFRGDTILAMTIDLNDPDIRAWAIALGKDAAAVEESKA